MIILAFIWTFNKFIKLNERVNALWLDLSAQLESRTSLTHKHVKNAQKHKTDLQAQEEKVQSAGRLYNDRAKELNLKLKVFPTNIIAKRLGIKPRDYFEIKDPQ